MKLDTSVAPEIAILAGHLDAASYAPPTRLAAEAGTAPSRPAGALTIGQLAACLRLLLADPQSWWRSVRFDRRHAVRIPVTAPSPNCEAWLLVLPPGYRGDEDADWHVACLVAGAMAEQADGASGGGTRPLAHGRTRVRGTRRPAMMINTGSGYAISLHARSCPVPPADALPDLPSGQPSELAA